MSDEEPNDDGNISDAIDSTDIVLGDDGELVELGDGDDNDGVEDEDEESSMNDAQSAAATLSPPPETQSIFPSALSCGESTALSVSELRLDDADGRRAFVRSGGLTVAIDQLDKGTVNAASGAVAAIRALSSIRVFRRRLVRMRASRALLRFIASSSSAVTTKTKAMESEDGSDTVSVDQSAVITSEVRSAVESLASLASADPKIPVFARFTGALGPLINIVRTATSSLPSASSGDTGTSGADSQGRLEVVRLVLVVLRACTVKSDSNCTAFARSGGVEAVLPYMNGVDDVGTFVPALGLISNLGRNQQCAKLLWSAGIVDSLLASISASQDDPRVLSLICQALLALLNNPPPSKTKATQPFSKSPSSSPSQVSRSQQQQQQRSPQLIVPVVHGRQELLCGLAEKYSQQQEGSKLSGLLLAVTARLACPRDRPSALLPSITRKVRNTEASVSPPPVADISTAATARIRLDDGAAKHAALLTELHGTAVEVALRPQCKCGHRCSCEVECLCDCNCECECGKFRKEKSPLVTEMSTPPCQPLIEIEPPFSRSRPICARGACSQLFSPEPEPLAPPHDQTPRMIASLLHDISVYSSTFRPYVVYDVTSNAPAKAIVAASGASSDVSPALIFESRFESGNLHRAVRTGDREYELATSIDTNAVSHTQWFYFSVRNMEKGVAYRFNIVNMEKPTSEFNHGLRPLMFSQAQFDKEKRGWFRTGENICYYANQYTRDIRANGYSHYYTLSFEVTFENARDTCWFAVVFPYTYTDLRAYIKRITGGDSNAIVRCTSMCKTLAGNDCYLLTITNFNASANDIQKRKYVFVTARVHPGESQSSFVAEGAIDFLLGDSMEARALRECFVFKVVPMLNPDGVIEGNHRVSLSGSDLNRVWVNPSPVAHPPVYNVKWLMKQVSAESSIALYVDLHGHFRKKNIFIYGCEAIDPTQPLSERLFPFLLSKRAPCVSMRNSIFWVAKGPKRGSGRMAVWKEFNVLNSFTIESSFSGMDEGRHEGMHLDPRLLRETGAAICSTLLEYSVLIGDGGDKLSSVMSELAAVVTALDERKRLEKLQKQQQSHPQAQAKTEPQTCAM